MGTIFVGGSMRTGTNLLHRILCGAPTAHERLQEAGFLTGLMETYVQQIESFPDRTLQYFDGWAAVHAFQRRVLEDFLAEVHKRHPDARDLVMKKPELTRTFPELARLLPDARFVVMLRDPRDTVSSMISTGKRQIAAGEVGMLARMGRDIPALCAHYASYYARLLPRMGDSALKGRVHFVRYEDLVIHPDGSIAALAAFTGMDLSSDALADQGTPTTGRRATFRTNLTGGAISASQVGRHQVDLSDSERAVVERSLTDLMRLFRYDAPIPRPTQVPGEIIASI